MKNFIYIILAFLITSCTEGDAPPIVCDDASLFAREDATGSMFYMACYESWAIELKETTVDGGRINAASLDIPNQFKVDGMRVKFDACFYEFDLPLILADPIIIGTSYVIRDFSISED